MLLGFGVAMLRDGRGWGCRVRSCGRVSDNEVFRDWRNWVWVWEWVWSVGLGFGGLDLDLERDRRKVLSGWDGRLKEIEMERWKWEEYEGLWLMVEIFKICKEYEINKGK